MVRISKKLFLVIALGSINFVARPDVVQKESLEKFLASALAQGEQKDTTKVKELLNLFDKIIDGLNAGGEGLSKIATPFYDLCAMIVKADASNSQSLEEIKAKLKEISLLIKNNKAVTPVGGNVINNISSFITLFEEFVGNPQVNGFFATLTQFVNQYEYGKQVVAVSAAVVVASLGTLIAWRIINKSKATTAASTTSTVVAKTKPATVSLEAEKEMQNFVDLIPAVKPAAVKPVETISTVSPVVVSTTPVSVTTPSDKPALIEKPVETTSTVVPTPTPSVIDLTTPTSVETTPAVVPVTKEVADHSNESADEDSSDYKSLLDTQESADAKKQEGSMPRQDAVGNLQPLIDEVAEQANKVAEDKKEQPKPEIVAPVAQEDRSTRTRYPLRNTKRTSYGAKKK